MAKVLNGAHRPWPIAQDDYIYVLAAFIVVPSRWINQHSWRALTRTELDATTSFYRRLGELMAIENLPQSYEDAERILDEYERSHIAASAAGTHLMEQTLLVMRGKLPRLLRPHAARITAALLDDLVMSRALGLADPPRWLRMAVRTTERSRNARTRAKPRPTESWFKPGRAASIVYPNGYKPEDLGPHYSQDDPR
jgi:hypothetical protein